MSEKMKEKLRTAPFKGLSHQEALLVSGATNLYQMNYVQLEDEKAKLRSLFNKDKNDGGLRINPAFKDTVIKAMGIIHERQLMLRGKDPHELHQTIGLTNAVGGQVILHEGQRTPPTDFNALAEELKLAKAAHKKELSYANVTQKPAIEKAFKKKYGEKESTLNAHNKSKAYFTKTIKAKERLRELTQQIIDNGQQWEGRTAAKIEMVEIQKTLGAGGF